MVVEHNNETANSNADDWHDCSPGEVSQMIRRLRTQHRMRLVRQSTSAAAIVALVFASGYFMKQTALPSESDHIIAGIYCSEVRQLGKDFMADKLDENKSAQINDHLADCESCRKFLENMLKGSQPPDAGAAQEGDKRFEQRVASRSGSIIPILSVTGS